MSLTASTRAAALTGALTLFVAGCGSGEAESLRESDQIETTSSAGSPTTTTPIEITSLDSTTTAPIGPIPDGGFLIVPDGPYIDGQILTLLALDSATIDLYNSSPRLCAQVDDNAEICDPSWVPPQPLRDAPPGTQGLVVEVPRLHFGPKGYSDCSSPEVLCRLLWMTETGDVLTSEELTFTGSVEPNPVLFDATIDERPGVVRVQARGLTDALTVQDLFSPHQMQMIEDDVNSMSEFAADRLKLQWRVSGLCGFGAGDPPIGSADLDSPPSWWRSEILDPTEQGATSDSYFGANCNGFLAENEPVWLNDDTVVDVDVSRHIYGYGGWIDCASESCWLELIASRSYPMEDGSTVGYDTAVGRVLLDIPDTWPSSRPSISIVEPGPYSPGQEVTVEVRNHPVVGDGLGVAWCPGGDSYCGYRFSSYSNGVHRVKWQIPAGSENCGPNRCYFGIDSRFEGLPPPAIIIVPITSG